MLHSWRPLWAPPLDSHCLYAGQVLLLRNQVESLKAQLEQKAQLELSMQVRKQRGAACE